MQLSEHGIRAIKTDRVVPLADNRNQTAPRTAADLKDWATSNFRKIENEPDVLGAGVHAVIQLGQKRNVPRAGWIAQWFGQAYTITPKVKTVGNEIILKDRKSVV